MTVTNGLQQPALQEKAVDDPIDVELAEAARKEVTQLEPPNSDDRELPEDVPTGNPAEDE